ncbi:MAG: DUF554 domain-containing protein [Lachnospiraceae bacterium]|nr:DUF554 domain-containing protein [Lachnospiraceae bacterium]
MIGIGSLINMAAIVVGGTIGLLFRKGMSERFQDIIIKSIALCIVFVGAAGAFEKMLVIREGSLQSQGTMMVISSFAAGSLVGELINLDQKFTDFGRWLQEKTGSTGDAAFVRAFVTASLTVCIGAMAIVGSIQEGTTGDYSTLATKAILDFLIILIMASSLGKGCIFSAIPVGVLQLSVTWLAHFLARFLTQPSLDALSLVGSMLIFCVGVNLIKEHTFKVANMLPTVIVAMIWGLLV